jgi:hypothetical protein
MSAVAEYILLVTRLQTKLHPHQMANVSYGEYGA